MTVVGNDYRLQVEHRWGDQRWLNTWIIFATTQEAAELLAEKVLDFHEETHISQIEILRGRLSTRSEDGRNFKSLPRNQSGARTISNFLPKFLTLNMLFAGPQWGDPMRKYFHLGFDNTQNLNGTIVGSLRSTVNTAWGVLASNFDANAFIYPAYGEVLPEVTIEQNFGYHQFKRKWARRTPA